LGTQVLHAAQCIREDPMQDQERIRRRAHEVWEREARLGGRHAQHWAQANQEIEAEGGEAPPPTPASSDDFPTVIVPTGGTTPAQAAAAADAVGSAATGAACSARARIVPGGNGSGPTSGCQPSVLRAG
jgi:hypothetical protein